MKRFEFGQWSMRMAKYRLVFSNDDIGVFNNAEHIRWFEEVVDYLNGRGIRATFFWVPLDEDGNEGNPKWMKAIEAAMNAGHDVQWHGLAHHGLEFGVPQPTFRQENKVAFELYKSEPLRWAYEHSLVRIKEKLTRGYEIFERNFGKPVVFRSPCLGACDALYQGLYDLGVKYSSSRVINPQSWLYTMAYEPRYRVWDPQFSPYPYKLFGVTEIPLMSDYSHWGIPEDRLDDILSLAKSDYQHLIAESRGMGVMLCHYHTMHKTWENTLRFYDGLIDFMVREHDVEFVTFKEALLDGQTGDKRWEQGGGGPAGGSVAARTKGSA